MRETQCDGLIRDPRQPARDLGGGSLTCARTFVGEGLAGNREELPVVTVGVEGEPQDAEGIGVSDFTVGLGHVEKRVVAPARADHELPHAGR